MGQSNPRITVGIAAQARVAGAEAAPARFVQSRAVSVGTTELMAQSARKLAHAILARDLAGEKAPTAAAAGAAAEISFQRLSNNLARWLGPDGTQALFTRALALAQAQNPALRVVPPPARSALFLDALAASAESHDARTVTDGVVMILTSLIELLSRLVGEDLVIKLVTEDGPGERADGASSSNAERKP